MSGFGKAHSMSWSVYLENFRQRPIENEPEVRALVEPLLDRNHYNVVLDGLPTEIYGIDDDPITGLSFSRLKGDEVWELIYKVAVLSDTAILPQDGPVCITDQSHRDWLPREIVDEVGLRIVGSGADIVRVVSEI